MGGRYIFSAVPIENAVKTIYPRENIYIKDIRLENLFI